MRLAEDVEPVHSGPVAYPGLVHHPEAGPVYPLDAEYAFSLWCRWPQNLT